MRLEIIAHFADYTYLPASYFAYDAAYDIINYDRKRLRSNIGRLCLLHEIAHAQLNHISYDADIELYMMEISAWRKTEQLAKKFDVTLNDQYIRQCLESYEQWLDARSSCPDCGNFCLNRQSCSFVCFVCGCVWQVNSRKDCQVRRRRLLPTQKPA